MARVETMVQLTDELIDVLDQEVRRRGISRSALIREAIADYLAKSAEAEITRQIVEGYKRVPQSDVDEWGDLGRQVESAAVELLRRLDAEERAEGHEPW